MGTTAGDKILEVDYPLAFGNAMSTVLQIAKEKKKFRFIHLSGAATERDQSKDLWFKSEMRKLKGTAENNTLAFAKQPGNQGLWESYVVKSGFVVTKDGMSPRDMFGWMIGGKSIKVDELAAGMIDIALRGSEVETLDNPAMIARGQATLKNE